MAKSVKKFLVLAVIFTMTVVNYGLPLQAIASDGESFFSFAFFRKNEISLDAYFDNDSKGIEETTDVNKTAKITLEVSPLIEGYLKSGILKFNLKNGNENNFKIQSVAIEEKGEITFDEMDSEKLETTDKIETTEDEETKQAVEQDISEKQTENVIINEKTNAVSNKNPFSSLLKKATDEASDKENLQNSAECYLEP